MGSTDTSSRELTELTENLGKEEPPDPLESEKHSSDSPEDTEAANTGEVELCDSNESSGAHNLEGGLREPHGFLETINETKVSDYLNDEPRFPTLIPTDSYEGTETSNIKNTELADVGTTEKVDAHSVGDRESPRPLVPVEEAGTSNFVGSIVEPTQPSNDTQTSSPKKEELSGSTESAESQNVENEERSEWEASDSVSGENAPYSGHRSENSEGSDAGNWEPFDPPRNAEPEDLGDELPVGAVEPVEEPEVPNFVAVDPSYPADPHEYIDDPNSESNDFAHPADPNENIDAQNLEDQDDEPPDSLEPPVDELLFPNPEPEAFEDDAVNQEQFHESSHEVVILENSAAMRLGLGGLYTLFISFEDIRLLDSASGDEVYSWPLDQIKKYGRDAREFSLEAGPRCATGPGYFYFITDEFNEVFQNVDRNVHRLAEIRRRQGQFANPRYRRLVKLSEDEEIDR